jgi:hypothetical protein
VSCSVLFEVTVAVKLVIDVAFAVFAVELAVIAVLAELIAVVFVAILPSNVSVHTFGDPA